MRISRPPDQARKRSDLAPPLRIGTNLRRIEPESDICANVYVLADDQQLIACCACPLTPNHLQTLSVKNDLVSNTLTPGIPTDVTSALSHRVVPEPVTPLPYPVE